MVRAACRGGDDQRRQQEVHRAGLREAGDPRRGGQQESAALREALRRGNGRPQQQEVRSGWVFQASEARGSRCDCFLRKTRACISPPPSLLFPSLPFPLRFWRKFCRLCSTFVDEVLSSFCFSRIVFRLVPRVYTVDCLLVVLVAMISIVDVSFWSRVYSSILLFLLFIARGPVCLFRKGFPLLVGY